MDVNNMFGSRKIRLALLSALRFIPDKVMIQVEYRLKMHKRLNLNSPSTFNEKLQWLKLYNRKDLYTQMVDKYMARELIKERIGEEYLVPIYGAWDNVKDIPFKDLPEEFVLKCTHDSGSVIVVRNKEDLDIRKVKKFLKSRLKKNAFWYGREWPYKNVKPRIIAEKLLKDVRYDNLPVFKIFCFSGEPRIIQQLLNDKQLDETVDYFDINWNRLNMKQRFPNSDTPIEKPVRLNEMLEIARKLACGVPFLRIDLYEVDSKIIFSECTFFTDAGYSVFEPEEEHWDERLGKLINLESVNIADQT